VLNKYEMKSNCPNKSKEKSAYITEQLVENYIIDSASKVVTGTVNGHKAMTIKLDTACDQTIVQAKFVEPYQYQKKSVTLRGLTGKVTLPLARVWLGCEYHTG
jgi:hypothetical protein